MLWFLPESLNHDSCWSPVLSAHPWKRQEAGRVFYGQGREAKDLFVSCDPDVGRQPRLRTALGKSSGYTPPFLQNVWHTLQCSKQADPPKGKQYAALPQRSYQLMQGISNTFGSFYWYSSLLFSSHAPSAPKQLLRELKFRAPGPPASIIGFVSWLLERVCVCLEHWSREQGLKGADVRLKDLFSS